MKKYIYSVVVSALWLVGMQGQADEQASRGARVEASFILQGKHNALLEHMQKVKRRLEEAQLTKKKLPQERELIASKLEKVEQEYRKIGQFGRRRRVGIVREERAQLSTLLAILDIELKYACLIDKLYPQYSRELDMLSLGLSKFIAELSEPEPILYAKVRSEIERGFAIKDKIEIEAQIMQLLLDSEKQRVHGIHKQKQLVEKQRKLRFINDEITRYGLSKKRSDYRVSLKKQIDYLKKIIPGIKERLQSKRQTLKTLKEQALKLNRAIYKDKLETYLLHRLNVEECHEKKEENSLPS